MIRDKKEARGATKLSGGGNQPLPDVDLLKLREMHQLRPKACRIFERNCRNKVKSKGKGKKGQWTLDSSTGGQWQEASQRQHAAGNRQTWPQSGETGRAIEKPKGKGKGKGKSGGKAKGKGKGLKCYVCGGIGHPARLCPTEGWLTTWSRTRPKEKTPMKKSAGLMRTTKHSN